MIDQTGTILVDGRMYRTKPMCAEEIASVTKFADEEVAKLDFTLPHYLMVHKLIYGSEKSIKVREPGFKELEVLRQKGSGREFLAYVNMRLSGQDSDGGDRAFSRDDDDNAFGARRGGAIPSRRRRGSRMKVSPDDRNAQANGDDVVTSNDMSCGTRRTVLLHERNEEDCNGSGGGASCRRAI